MTTKQMALRWFDEVWNKKNPSAISDLMDAKAVGTTEGGEIRGPAEFRSAVYEPLVKAFPDVKVKIDSVIAEGNEAMLRWTVVATHTGPLAHVPPSGKKVKFNGMTCLTFRDGKVVSGADSYNLHGLVAYLSGGPASATVRAP